MKLSELLRDVPVLETNMTLAEEITGVSYDSRETKAGDLFVAMAGFATDGHRFIPMALERRGGVRTLPGEAGGGRHPLWSARRTAVPPWPGWAAAGTGTPPPA